MTTKVAMHVLALGLEVLALILLLKGESAHPELKPCHVDAIFTRSAKVASVALCGLRGEGLQDGAPDQ